MWFYSLSSAFVPHSASCIEMCEMYILKCFSCASVRCLYLPCKTHIILQTYFSWSLQTIDPRKSTGADNTHILIFPFPPGISPQQSGFRPSLLLHITCKRYCFLFGQKGRIVLLFSLTCQKCWIQLSFLCLFRDVDVLLGLIRLPVDGFSVWKR